MATPEARGWGKGYPVNRMPDMRLVVAPSGAKWYVHKDIAFIVSTAVNQIEANGYKFDHGPIDTDDDWGYSNRPIRGSKRPSNHSWGLAIDIDAQNYPMGQRKKKPPQWVIDTFRRFGFTWGGQWGRPDPMHFEFMGTPADAARIRRQLGEFPSEPAPKPTPPVASAPDEDEDEMKQLLVRRTSDGKVIFVNGNARFWVNGADYNTLRFLGVQQVDVDANGFAFWERNTLNGDRLKV